MFGTSGDPRKGHATFDKSKSTSPEPGLISKPPGSPKQAPGGSHPQTPPSPVVGTGLGQGVPDPTTQVSSVVAEHKPSNVAVRQMSEQGTQPPDKVVVQGSVLALHSHRMDSFCTETGCVETVSVGDVVAVGRLL